MPSRFRSAAVVLLSILIVPASSGASLDPGAAIAAGAEVSPAVSDAVSIRDDLASFARGFEAGAPIAEQLARASELAVGAGTTASVKPVGFDAALAWLYRVAGVQARLDVRPPEHLADAVAPVIAAIARAGELAERAFAHVTPRERTFLLRHLDELEAPRPDRARWRRLDAIGDRVAVEHLHRGSALIAAAIDALPEDLGELEKSWVDPSGMIEIGSSSPDAYGSERVLIVDLGGSDIYQNHAAAVGPGSTLPLPVSVVVDAGGDDAYVNYAFEPASGQNYLWTQGTGLGGIGLLVDRWGNDYYGAYSGPSLFPFTNFEDCRPDVPFGVAYRQVIHAQGVGAFGVGMIADLSGSDYYDVFNSTQSPTDCHFVKAYSFTQGTGLHRGLGLLIDDTGRDFRVTNSQSFAHPGHPFAQDFIAGTYTQGAAAGGVGLLVDKEGEDYYGSYAFAQGSFTNSNKGAFATVFSQGAVMGLTEEWAAGPRTGPSPVGLGGPPSPCSPLAGNDGQGRHGSCSGPGIGILIDAIGDDTFDSAASALQGQGAQNQLCTVAAHALTASQGAAGWGGLGANLNLDAAGTDIFQLRPYATGGPCPFDDTRAYAVGQGFGGRVHYPIWDDPHGRFMGGTDQITINVFLPTPGGSAGGYATVRPSVPPIGVLVSGGGTCPLAPDPTGRDPVICEPGLGSLVSSPDHYGANPVATNLTGNAIAESWVQGSANGPQPTTIQGFYLDPTTGQYQQVNLLEPTGHGIGVHVDVGGDDRYQSYPYANGAGPLTRAVSVAQGATIDGLAALVNVGGDDFYDSLATAFGGPATSRGTGSAELVGPVYVQPLALFADIGGQDAYAGPAACKSDGVLMAPVIWGDLATCGANAGALTIGLDLISELPL